MEHCVGHTQCMERVTKVEESTKSAHHRIDKVEEDQKILLEMNTNIKLLAEQSKGNTEDIKSMQSDVKEMKEKPSKRWDSVVNAFVVAIASGLAGAFLMLILK